MIQLARTRRLLYLVAFFSGALILLRGGCGPYYFVAPVHNPVGLECTFALSVLLLLATSGGFSETLGVPRIPAAWATILVTLAAGIAYVPVLTMPLVTDDYIHIQQVSREGAPTPLQSLTHSCGGCQFFRPLGISTYWAEWQLWGKAAMPRHLFDLVLHMLSTALFLLLLRRLGVPPPFDWLGALLFALSGVLVESVVWPAARFDALALCFSLLAGIAALRRSRDGLLISLGATAAACLSKESAYVLPLLLALLIGQRIRTRAGQTLVLSNLAVAGGIFAWRWVMLRGIAGYLGPTGSPMVLQLNAITLAKTFLARVWGVLWFPINWSRPLEVWMLLGLAGGIAGSLLLGKARPNRVQLWLCIAGVAVACIPTHHMLLIGPSLEQSRYLTYATPAFITLLVTACTGLPRRIGGSALVMITAFNLTALEHNQRIWKSIASARYQLSRTVAAAARDTAGVIAVDGLPSTLDGIYWRNGLEDSLDLDFGIPMGKVRVNEPYTTGLALHLRWDPEARVLR